MTHPGGQKRPSHILLTSSRRLVGTRATLHQMNDDEGVVKELVMLLGSVRRYDRLYGAGVLVSAPYNHLSLIV